MNVLIRELEVSDYNKGYINLLNQLTECDISYEDFERTFYKMSDKKKIFVLHDYDNLRVVGTASVLIEEKFQHGCRPYLHIEDVVILDEYRGNGLGKILIKKIINYSIDNNCYKILLNCNSLVKNFYIKNGFKETDLGLTLYLNN